MIIMKTVKALISLCIKIIIFPKFQAVCMRRSKSNDKKSHIKRLDQDGYGYRLAIDPDDELKHCLIWCSIHPEPITGQLDLGSSHPGPES